MGPGVGHWRRSMFEEYCLYVGSSSSLTIEEWCIIVQDNIDFVYLTMEAGGKIVSVSALSGVY